MKKTIKKTNIGGQALIEGIIMLGPKNRAMANLLPSGKIVVKDYGPNPIQKSTNLPIVRGAVRIFKQLVVGTKALFEAAEIWEQAEENEKTNFENKLEDKIGTKKVAEQETENGAEQETKNEAEQEIKNEAEKETKKETDWVLMGSAVLGMMMGIGIFILLPNVITSAVLALFGINDRSASPAFLYNIVEGILRIAILLFYLWLSAKQKDIARVWQFHGAEHKTIACYEAGEELTVENVRKYSRFHPRCGTSLLFVLVFISTVIFAIVGWYGVIINLLIRLALIPIVAGLSYEVLLFAGKHSETRLGRMLAAPGLALQRLTTQEPSEDNIIATAIAAMNLVIPNDDSDAWAK